MNIGAFAVMILLEKEGEMDAAGNRLAGWGKRKPLLAAVMAIFMFSLAGVPPFAGFFAKFFVFAAAGAGRLVVAGGHRHAQQRHRRLLLSAPLNRVPPPKKRNLDSMTELSTLHAAAESLRTVLAQVQAASRQEQTR
jgi:hypothetical protein